MSFPHHQDPAKSLASSSPATKEPDSLELGDGGSPVSHASNSGGLLLGLLFLVGGTAQLYYWNALLNVVGDINVRVYPDHKNLSDTLTAGYNTANLLAAVIITWRGSLNLAVNFTSGFALAAVQILTAICVSSVKGSGGVAFLHVLAVIGGGSCGFYQACQYAIAGAMPVGQGGWVSVGNGSAGVLTFGIWMILSQATLKDEPVASLWWMMSIGAVLLLFSNYCMYRMARRADVKANMETARERIRALAQDPSTPSYWKLCQLIAPMLITVFFVYFVTLFVYPAIGPFRWNYDGNVEANVLMGTFQVGDFLGRSIPLLTPWLPWILLAPRILYSCCAGRGIFILIFVLMWKQKDVALWDSYGWQIFILFIMAVSNGWLGTCAMVLGPSRVPNVEHRARAAALCVVGLLLGIVVGLWTARLATL